MNMLHIDAISRRPCHFFSSCSGFREDLIRYLLPKLAKFPNRTISFPVFLISPPFIWHLYTQTVRMRYLPAACLNPAGVCLVKLQSKCVFQVK